MIVVDASVIVAACLAPGGLDPLGGRPLGAPALMWSEARSVLHELVWRGEVTPEDGWQALALVEAAPVERLDHERVGEESWRVADELGWAKTYAAEYVALARLLGTRLLTLDARLHRGASRLGVGVSPGELGL